VCGVWFLLKLFSIMATLDSISDVASGKAELESDAKLDSKAELESDAEQNSTVSLGKALPGGKYFLRIGVALVNIFFV
jgi:hypothetical protein